MIPMNENNKKTLEVLTLFPEPVQALLNSSILRRAQAKGIVDLQAKDLRSFGLTKHRNVDDTPFGGGPGMLMRADVLNTALESALAEVGGVRDNLKVLYATPRGVPLTQGLCETFAEWIVKKDQPSKVVFVSGRYEGVDERFISKWVDVEFSLGDFIVTGGELPSLCFIDAIVRLLPGVLSDVRSNVLESFSNGLIEYPQFTKPREFLGKEVPEVLLEGNHAKMDEWKLKTSLFLTFAFRPDLIRAHSGEGLPKWAVALLQELQSRL